MRRIVLAVSLVAAASLGVVQEAAAVEKTFSVSKTFTAADGRQLTQSATGRILTGNATTLSASVDCEASTLSPAAAIGLPQCFLIGADGTRYDAGDSGAIPGLGNAQWGVFHEIPRQRYWVCVKANVFWQDSTYFAGTRTCAGS